MCKYFCYDCCAIGLLNLNIPKNLALMIAQYIHPHKQNVLKELLRETKQLMIDVEHIKYPSKYIVKFTKKYYKYHEPWDLFFGVDEVCTPRFTDNGWVCPQIRNLPISYTPEDGYKKVYHIPAINFDDTTKVGQPAETPLDISNIEYEIEMERFFSWQKNYVHRS
jgi:hypothetical protein